jgi:large subunit ribosomal protein L33
MNEELDSESEAHQDGASRARRVPISLACSVCGARNHKTTKQPTKVVALKKHCRACNRHTLHRETK